MKVILVQSEIEAALIAYVRSQITVKDGVDITVDLKATRGDQGTTAEIDFVSVEQAVDKEKAVATPVNTEVKTAEPAKTVKTVKAVKEVAEKPVEAAAKPEETVVEAAEGSGDASSEDKDETQAEEAAADEGQAAEASATAGAKKPSLFGGLKRPVNP